MAEDPPTSMKFFVGHEGVFAYFQQILRYNIHDDPYYWLRKDVEDEVFGADNLRSRELENNFVKLISYGTGADRQLIQLLEKAMYLKSLTVFYLPKDEPCYSAISRMEALTRLELFDTVFSVSNLELLTPVLDQLEHFTLVNSSTNSVSKNCDCIDSLLMGLNPDKLRHLTLNELRYPMERLQEVMLVKKPKLGQNLTHLTINLKPVDPARTQPHDCRMSGGDLLVACIMFPSLVYLNVCLYTRVSYWEIVENVSRLDHLVELRIFSDYDERDKGDYNFQGQGHAPITTKLPNLRRLTLSGRNDCTSNFVSILPRMFPNLEELNVVNEKDFVSQMRNRFLKNFKHLRKFSMYLNSDLKRFVVPRFEALHNARYSAWSESDECEFEFSPYGEMKMPGKKEKRRESIFLDCVDDGDDSDGDDDSDA